jgi:hypothetical protein
VCHTPGALFQVWLQFLCNLNSFDSLKDKTYYYNGLILLLLWTANLIFSVGGQHALQFPSTLLCLQWQELHQWYPMIYPVQSTSVCLSVCLSVRPSVRPSFCLSVCLYPGVARVASAITPIDNSVTFRSVMSSLHSRLCFPCSLHQTFITAFSRLFPSFQTKIPIFANSPITLLKQNWITLWYTDSVTQWSNYSYCDC